MRQREERVCCSCECVRGSDDSKYGVEFVLKVESESVRSRQSYRVYVCGCVRCCRELSSLNVRVQFSRASIEFRHSASFFAWTCDFRSTFDLRLFLRGSRIFQKSNIAHFHVWSFSCLSFVNGFCFSVRTFLIIHSSVVIVCCRLVGTSIPLCCSLFSCK